MHHEPLTLNRVLRGPWSWMLGTVVILIGSLGVLLVSGKPWGVTSSFAFWGAKISLALGIPVENWDYWQAAKNNQALHTNVFHDMTTLSDIGIMLGAYLALALSNSKISFSLRPYPPRMIIGLFVGGILMGYGARLAFGCNIGAYFSGIASFSLHGWIWFVMAMLGSWVGVEIRRTCGFTR